MKIFSLTLAILWVAFVMVAADHVPQSDIIPDVPRDGIPPLDNPKYESVLETTWLEDEDWVISYERDGDARAFPVKIMNWHEIVNDTIGGLEVLVSYCPLCRSGLVFDRHLNVADVPPEAQGVLPDDAVLSFGNTGSLYENDMVMYDRDSDSQWFQVGGEALTGALHGTKLKRLPASMMRWAQFKENYPTGKVLSRETGHRRDYSRDAFANYNKNQQQLFFPISEIDDRLPAKSRVLGLEFDEISKTYNLDALKDGVYADRIGSQLVALFVQQSAGVAYDPRVEGLTLSFELKEDQFVDEQTGSTWGFSGKATAGALEGTQLERLVQANVYWFSWALVQPDTKIVPEYTGFVPYAPSAVATKNVGSEALETQGEQNTSGNWLWWAMLGAIVAGLGVLLLNRR